MAPMEIRIVVIAACVWSSAGGFVVQSEAAEPNEVRAKAERSFDQFQQRQGSAIAAKPAGADHVTAESGDSLYYSGQYVTGNGQGDLSKGMAVCLRVAELSARADLAKQIRVLVKEHMVDRTHERAGREPEQDVELTREEIVQEYLQGVKIVDHGIDEESKICTATAVMPKGQAQPKPTPATSELPPTVTR